MAPLGEARGRTASWLGGKGDITKSDLLTKLLLSHIYRSMCNVEGCIHFTFNENNS